MNKRLLFASFVILKYKELNTKIIVLGWYRINVQCSNNLQSFFWFRHNSSRKNGLILVYMLSLNPIVSIYVQIFNCNKLYSYQKYPFINRLSNSIIDILCREGKSLSNDFRDYFNSIFASLWVGRSF